MIIIFASCGKKAPNEAKYIPKDATIVIAIDSKSLGDKMSKGNIPLDTFISRLQKNADTVSAKNKQYWEDFKNSGVSLDNNLYFFPTGSYGNIYLGCIRVFDTVVNSFLAN